MKRILAALAIAAVALIARPAFAGSAADTFVVTATVDGACTIVANDLTFATAFNAAAPANVDATSTILVTCTGGTNTAVLGLSGAPAGAVRQMSGPGGAVLDYQLYSDNGRTVVWNGEAPGAGFGRVALANFGTLSTVTSTVYGRVPAAQNLNNLPAGTYTQTVTATVSF